MEPGAGLQVGMVPWVGGVGADHRTGWWEDALPTRRLTHGHPRPPPMPGTELGAERGAELEPLRSLGAIRPGAQLRQIPGWGDGAT